MERIQLNSILTQKQLERMLNVSPMTIYLWRKRETDPLPCRTYPTKGGRHKNYFLTSEVAGWLNRNRPTLVYRAGGGDNAYVRRNTTVDNSILQGIAS